MMARGISRWLAALRPGRIPSGTILALWLIAGIPQLAAVQSCTAAGPSLLLGGLSTPIRRYDEHERQRDFCVHESHRSSGLRLRLRLGRHRHRWN